MQNVATLNPPASGALKKRAGVFLIGTVLFFLWFVLCRDLSGEWSVNEQYSYGWFVPFFALYLFWLRWEARPAPEVPPRRAGSGQRSEVRERAVAILIAIFALLLLLPVRLFEIGNPDWRPLGWIHAAAVATLTLIYIWYAGGKPWLRHFAFPVAFFFVAVPWVTPIEAPVIQGLMRAIAAAASETLNLLGVPAHLQGNLIRVSSGLVGVNEACSGVRSLQTSLMIGLLFGELKRLSILRRIFLVAGAVAIALVANFGRTLFLVWIAATKNVSEVSRWHDVAGYTIVGLVVIGSIALAALLAKGGQRDQRFATANPSSGGSEGRDQNGASGASDMHGTAARVAESDAGAERMKTVAASVSPAMNSLLQPTRLPLQLLAIYFTAALCWLLFVEFAAAGWYRAHEHNLIPRPLWNVSWDRLPAGFHAIKIPDDVRQTLRFDDGREVVWQTSDPSSPEHPSTDYLFFFRWNPGSSSVLRARAHRPDICLPSAGWTQIADRGAKNYVARDGTVLPVRHIAFKQEGRHGVAHTFFCLQEDKVHLEESRPDLALAQGVQPDWSVRARVEVVRHGVRNLGQQVLEVVILTPQSLDDGMAEEKFATIVQELIKVEVKQ